MKNVNSAGITRKILIVDDDKAIREVVKKRLIQEGYKVLSASIGQRVLSICKTKHPDLVLLDIAIPQMNGYRVCEKIKQDPKTRDIPVLFVTGKELELRGIIKRCRDLDAYGYISKPYTFKELLEKIKEILGT